MKDDNTKQNQPSTKYLNAIIGFSLGALLWFLSPLILGHKEPWDASMPFYLIAILTFGALASIPSPKNYLVGPTFIYIGQFTYIFTVHGGGNLWPIALVLGIIYTIPALIGSLIARLLLKKVKNRET